MSKPISLPQLVSGIVNNRCPECEKGSVYSGFFTMNKKCPDCGMLFDKEQGYFLGALIVGYFVEAFSLLPLMVYTLFLKQMALPLVLLMGTAQILIMTPFVTRFAKITWLYVESRLTWSLK